MKIKKIAAPIGVITAGLIIGALLSYALPNAKNIIAKSQTALQPQTTQSPSNSQDLIVELTAVPKSVKASGDLDPVTEIANIDKASLEINYENKSSKDLTGIQIFLTPEATIGVGFASSEIGKHNKELSSENLMVFDLPDAKAGSVNTANVYVFSKDTGEIKISAEVKTREGLRIKTNTVTINTK